MAEPSKSDLESVAAMVKRLQAGAIIVNGTAMWPEYSRDERALIERLFKGPPEKMTNLLYANPSTKWVSHG